MNRKLFHFLNFEWITFVYLIDYVRFFLLVPLCLALDTFFKYILIGLWFLFQLFLYSFLNFFKILKGDMMHKYLENRNYLLAFYSNLHMVSCSGVDNRFELREIRSSVRYIVAVLLFETKTKYFVWIYQIFNWIFELIYVISYEV